MRVLNHVVDCWALKNVVDTMHRRATEIYYEKKALLDKGDEALLLQVGEGKDFMSILCESGFRFNGV